MRQRPFRPIPPPPPPLLDGRPLPPGFPDMCFTPPRLPPPMMDRRYPDERSLPPPPLPFEPPPWLPPPLPGGRSPPHMDRYSPRDGDRSPSSFHSSIPASGSSASLNRTNVASTPSSRSQVMSPPHLVDRGPPHVARPQPEFGIPSSRGETLCLTIFCTVRLVNIYTCNTYFTFGLVPVILFYHFLIINYLLTDHALLHSSKLILQYLQEQPR